MIYLIISFIIIGILYTYSFTFRMSISEPKNLLKYICLDIINYRKSKGKPKKPFINIYVGLFGMGKTLSMIHDVIDFYNQFNNIKVWDDRFNRWAIQKVFVLSNVHINGIKYRKLKSLSQLNQIAKWRHISDKKKHYKVKGSIKYVRTLTIVVLDEASTQLNSRNFKSNFSSQTLGTLLTSRHALIHGFYMTSQRFGHCDALLRQVTNNVIQCDKKWRFQKLTYYDAWSYENSPRPAEAPADHVEGFFITDKDYAAYNTLAVVDQLIKDTEDGNMLSDREILENRGSGSSIWIQSGEKKKGKKRK